MMVTEYSKIKEDIKTKKKAYRKRKCFLNGENRSDARKTRSAGG